MAGIVLCVDSVELRKLNPLWPTFFKVNGCHKVTLIVQR